MSKNLRQILIILLKTLFFWTFFNVRKIIIKGKQKAYICVTSFLSISYHEQLDRVPLFTNNSEISLYSRSNTTSKSGQVLHTHTSHTSQHYTPHPNAPTPTQLDSQQSLTPSYTLQLAHRCSSKNISIPGRIITWLLVNLETRIRNVKSRSTRRY